MVSRQQVIFNKVGINLGMNDLLEEFGYRRGCTDIGL